MEKGNLRQQSSRASLLFEMKIILSSYKFLEFAAQLNRPLSWTGPFD